MQYILTQEEYDTLLETKKAKLQLEDRELQDLCTKIAKEMPVQCSWNKTGRPSPWGCILDSEEPEEYCDDCPVQDICPNDYKGYSK